MTTLLVFLSLTMFLQSSITIQTEKEKKFLLAIPENGTWNIKTSPDIKNGARLTPLGIMRGIRLGELEVSDHVSEVRVEFSSDPWASAPKRAFSPSFLKLFSRILVNPPLLNTSHLSGMPGTGARYIIIVADSLYNWCKESLEIYKEWKSREGFLPILLRLSDIGESAEDIKNYLQDAYFNWEIPPEYVLLIGDPTILPAYTYPDPGGCGGTYVVDDYFATLEGEDMIADIFVGRFSVATPPQLETVIEKSLKVECDPDLSDPDYFKRAVFMAGDAYEPDTIYYSPKLYAKDLLFQIGFTQVDTFFVTPDHTPSSAEVLEAIDEGCQFINFRANSGGLPAYPFNDVVPDGLSNGFKLPIYVAISCLLGNFDVVEPSYDEMWLRAGSPTEPKGAVAVIAASGCTFAEPGDYWFHTIRRNAVDKGIFRAFTLDSLWHLGPAFERGRLNVYGECPMPLWAANYHYTETNLQGDPTLPVWTDTPSPLETEYPREITIENPTLTVSVRKNGMPLKGAIVCLREDTSLYELGETDETGTVEFHLQFHHMGLMDITITGQNSLPDTGRIIITSEISPFIYPTHYGLLDTIRGNGDSVPNPGEAIRFKVNLTNAGGSTAHNTRVTLSTNTNYITIIDSVDSIGEIPVDDTITSEGLLFEVSPIGPDRYPFNLTLGIKSSNSPPFYYEVPYEIFSPKLHIDSVLVFDSENDYFLDPRDTASILLFLANTGSASTESLFLHLSTQSPYLSVLDSTAGISPIPPDSFGKNAENDLIVSVADSVPPGKEEKLTLVVANVYGFTDTLNFSLRIGGRDYLVYNPVAEPSSGRIIPDLLDSLGYSGIYTQKWDYYRNKLFSFKTVWVTLGAPPSDVAITDSADVSALIDYINSGGSLYIEGARAGHDLSPEILDLIGIRGMSFVSIPNAVIGVPGVFTQGFAFGYDGGFYTIDNFSDVDPNTRVILKAIRGNNVYNVGIAYPGENHRSVISSVEIGRLRDSTATKLDLVQGLMTFFLTGEEVKEDSGEKNIAFRFVSLSPNPALNRTRVVFSIDRKEKVTLKIYDPSGRLVSIPLQKILNKGVYSMEIQLLDHRGRPLPQGVYFLRLKSKDRSQIKKLVILR